MNISENFFLLETRIVRTAKYASYNVKLYFYSSSWKNMPSENITYKTREKCKNVQ